MSSVSWQMFDQDTTDVIPFAEFTDVIPIQGMTSVPVDGGMSSLLLTLRMTSLKGMSSVFFFGFNK